ISLTELTSYSTTITCVRCGSRETRYGWHWDQSDKPHCRKCYKRLHYRGSWKKGNGWKIRCLIANPFKGRTHSLESRLKISLAKTGKSNSMKGRAMPRHAKFGKSNPSWKG